MKHYRLIAMALALMLICTSCGKGDTKTENTDSTPAVTDTEVVTDEAMTDGLPADLNYGDKTVNILNMEYIISGPIEYDPETSVHGQQASVVQEANYYRRLAVEERLGVKINFIEETTYKNIPGLVRQSVNAGSSDYDMVFSIASQQVTLAQEGLYVPVNDLLYVDLDKPWWNKEYIESVSVNVNNPYILFGDITYNTVQRTCAVLFNKALLEERLGMTDEDMYEIVLNGEWTIDKMAELASQVYEDDGNTINDVGDIHGIISFGSNTFEWLAYSAGLEFTSRDEDGYPVLNLNTEKAVDLCDKLLKLLSGEYTFVTTNNGEQVTKFAEGNALFLANRLFLTDWAAIREMKDDYGIIPMPKFDEDIDTYHCVVENLVQWGGVTVTAQDIDMISAVAESMAYEGYQKVMPAYYETALKLKYTRGEDVDTETQIIDLIAQNARTDFLYMNKLGGLGSIFANVHNVNQNNFASLYASSELAAKGELNELIEEDMANQE
ncbi:MAG: extracellular solute-binding protein [Clostridia bacterium]|nr:extracellular solute-binding protein [Clostridia bacterium]